MFPQVAFGFMGDRPVSVKEAIARSSSTGYPSQLVPSVAQALSASFGVVDSGGTPSSPLADSAIAYFAFDDTSSTLISPDTIGNYRIYFQYNSAVYVDGLIGSAVTTAISGGSIPDIRVQTSAGGFTAGTEIDLGATGFLGITMWTQAFSPRSYFSAGNFSLYSDLSGALCLDVVSDSGTNTITASEAFGDYYSNTWHLIGAEINTIAGTCKLRINHSSVVSGTFGSTSSIGFGDVKLHQFGSTNNIPLIDRLHFYSAPMTDAQFLYLYDDDGSDTYGTGIGIGMGTTSYPFVGAP